MRRRFRDVWARIGHKRTLSPVFRYTLRTTDFDDVGDGVHEDERWLRPGDVFEHVGARLRVVDRLLAPETDPDYVAAILVVERV